MGCTSSEPVAPSPNPTVEVTVVHSVGDDFFSSDEEFHKVLADAYWYGTI